MNTTSEYLLQTIQYALPKLHTISDEHASEKPTVEKWSYKEIIGHLIDSAANNHQKFLRATAEDGVSFPSYAQDYWVSTQHYNEVQWHQLLHLWEHYNTHLAHIMKHIPGAALDHTIHIGASLPVTLESIMKDYITHIRHHLLQIDKHLVK